MKFLAKLNEIFKLSEVKYVMYSPNDYVYDKLGEFTLFVYFNGDVYRQDGFKLWTEVTREMVYSIITDDNKTWITKYNKTLEDFIAYTNEGNGGRGKILSEIKTI